MDGICGIAFVEPVCWMRDVLPSDGQRICRTLALNYGSSTEERPHAHTHNTC